MTPREADAFLDMVRNADEAEKEADKCGWPAKAKMLRDGADMLRDTAASIWHRAFTLGEEEEAA